MGWVSFTSVVTVLPEPWAGLHHIGQFPMPEGFTKDLLRLIPGPESDLIPVKTGLGKRHVIDHFDPLFRLFFVHFLRVVNCLKDKWFIFLC